MNTSKFIKVLPVLWILAQSLFAQDSLPDCIRIELGRLQETWNVLDQVSTKVWPGWTNYTDPPFLFAFPNGVQLLVGHPQPPEGFSLVTGVEIRGKKVYLDRRKEVPLPMSLPLFGGGGPVPFGMSQGKNVTVVRIGLSSPRWKAGEIDEKARARHFSLGSENQILLYAHELFHCFQASVYRSKYGNLRFNTDENYAAYAEVEGLALERSYAEQDDELAKEYLKDFLGARELKRRSMNETERLQESEEDVNEGTATYAEFMTLRQLEKGYQPLLAEKDDPYFYGFDSIDSLIDRRLTMLRSSRTESLESRGKSYPFGCFQAVLLSRLFRGWREGFFQKGLGLDRVMDSLLTLSPQERTRINGRLNGRYGVDTIYAKHARIVGERNQAFDMVSKRKGLTFVVNFKNTGEFPVVESTQTSYRIGLINIYPRGIKKIRIADVVFEGEDTPMVTDQIYFVKWIDTQANGSRGSYQIEGTREGTTNIYQNAVVKTSGFRLVAPRLEIKERKNRVKLTVLGKVKM
ncbi:MAG: hypothetical protein WBD36_16035 [Bacteroidota bacterium]